MSLDLIKQYLVGIGFNVDSSSLGKAKQCMNEAEKSVKSFAKNNIKGMSDTNESMKDISSIMKSSLGSIPKLFPEINSNLGKFVVYVGLIKQVLNNFSKAAKGYGGCI